MYKIAVSPRAARMFAEHIKFLSRVSKTASNDLRKMFLSHTESLKEMPERFPFINNPYLPTEKYRKLLFAKRYLIIFQIKGSTVYIDYVLDCRKDYHNLL